MTITRYFTDGYLRNCLAHNEYKRGTDPCLVGCYVYSTPSRV